VCRERRRGKSMEFEVVESQRLLTTEEKMR
jgi:hypothetical protein